MHPVRRRVLGLLLAALAGIWLAVPTHLLAQQASPAQIYITRNDVSRAPTIELQVYGRDAQGAAVDFTNQFVAVFHASTLVAESQVQVVGSVDVGTLTLFLLDLPTGVSNEVAAIQQAIEAYAAEPFMQEQVDYVAIYEVGSATAASVLEPVGFQNSVRNHFAANPLTTQATTTALYDSLGGLLNNVAALKPNPIMVASIVLLTDGTDAVSQEFQMEELAPLAASLGIPIHTVWLENSDLGDFGRTAGQEFLSSLAAQTGGVAARLDEAGQLDAIWSRISEFRAHTLIQYVLSEVAGGTFEVEVGLPDAPTIQSGRTTVAIQNNLPIIAFAIPDQSAEALAFALPDLEQPVRLRFPTAVSWLDGQTRSVTAAQLIVNGEVAADIPPAELTSFTAEVSNLRYGVNNVRVVIQDEQGFQAQSPDLVLTLQEGPRLIPDALDAGASGGRLLGLGVMVLFLLGLLAFLVWFALRRVDWSELTGRLRRRTPAAPTQPTPADAPPTTAPAPPPAAPTVVAESHAGAGSRAPQAYLDILETKTPLPRQIPVNRPEFLIGRNPNSDLAFTQDATVSRIHCTIVRDGSVYRIFDEQSTSHTYVNDQEVPEYGLQLKDGDEIYLGDVHLRFHTS